MNLSEKNIEEIRKKRKWRKIADSMKDKRLENEVEDEGKLRI